MKRFLAVSVLAGIVSSQALAVISGDWEYIVVGGNATIIKYRGTNKAVVVPSAIDNFSVKDIRSPANRLSTFTNDPSSINLPTSLTNIGNSTFYSLRNLTNLNIPNTVKAIGECAIANCVGLTNLTIPNGVTSIGPFAFQGCEGLTNITLPITLTNIGFSAFNGCLNLSGITIPESVTSLETSAFHGCSSFTEIVIPNTVTNISDAAFYSCYSVTNVTVGSGVKYISNNSFGGMLSLATMRFLGDAPSISPYAPNPDPFYDTPPFTLFYSQGTTGWGSSFAGRQTTLSGNFNLALAFDATKGSVANSPSGNSFSPGTSVSLSAIPMAGYAFTSWSGDSSSTNNPLVLVMNANKVVTANFGPDTRDTDGDGLSNYQEVILFYTDPNQAETNSPVAGLYLMSQYQSNRTSGRNEVLTSPNSYGLFNSNQMLDLNFGGIVLGKTNNQFVLTYQINQSTNLIDWTSYREESLVITNTPSDRMFLRLAPKQ